eukprot:2363043-Rhodomonas_salina.4
MVLSVSGTDLAYGATSGKNRARRMSSLTSSALWTRAVCAYAYAPTRICLRHRSTLRAMEAAGTICWY